MNETDVVLSFQAFADSEKCREIVKKLKANMRADFPIPAIEQAAWRLAKSAPRERRKTFIELWIPRPRSGAVADCISQRRT